MRREPVIPFLLLRNICVIVHNMSAAEVMYPSHCSQTSQLLLLLCNLKQCRHHRPVTYTDPYMKQTSGRASTSYWERGVPEVLHRHPDPYALEAGCVCVVTTPSRVGMEGAPSLWGVGG